MYVKNEEDALDVMQEVAYRTFKNIKSLKNIDYIRQNGNVMLLQSEWLENMEQPLEIKGSWEIPLNIK